MPGHARHKKGPDGLSDSQREFVRLIAVEGCNLTDAFLMSHSGKPPKNRQYAGATASKLAKQPAVAAALNAHAATVAASLSKVVDSQIISRETISQQMARIAFCEGFIRLRKPDGTAVVREVAVSEMRRAAMNLAQLHGYIIERRDVRIIRSVEDLSDEELAALAGNKTASDGRATRH